MTVLKSCSGLYYYAGDGATARDIRKRFWRSNDASFALDLVVAQALAAK